MHGATLKQLALAALMHEEANGAFPVRRLGMELGGRPGSRHRSRAAGWMGLHDTAVPRNGEYGRDGFRRTPGRLDGCPDERRRRAADQFPSHSRTAPSRRAAAAYPCGWTGAGPAHTGSGTHTPYGASPVTEVARTDYAMCAGNQSTCWSYDRGPPDLPTAKKWTESGSWPIDVPEKPNGIAYLRSAVALNDVSDGTSSTYVLGEKYVNTDHYFNGLNAGRQREHVLRLRQRQPPHGLLQTRPVPPFRSCRTLPATSMPACFGSPHPGICNMAFCDGSVQAISLDIDPLIHSRMGNRHDGEVVDKSQY